MALDILLFVLGIPVSWASEWGLRKIKSAFRIVHNISLQSLFLKAFYQSLDRHKEKYGNLLKELKKTVKDNENAFLKIFTAHARDYNTIISALHDDKFFRAVAADVVKKFPVGKNFNVAMELVIADCLNTFRAEFFNAMDTTQMLQLLLLNQAMGIEKIVDSLQSFETRIVSQVKNMLDEHELEFKPDAALPKEKKGKQVKILSIIAVPDEEDELWYEREQDTLLETFNKLKTDDVYVDMPDPVNSTLKEIVDYLADGKHDILQITAHGQINENGVGYLCLEDAEGKLHRVTGEKLFDELRPLGTIPFIVILTACHSAREEPELMPAALALFNAGINTVIGMKQKISHLAAIDFNRAFFNALCGKKTIKDAFEQGKQAVMEGEQKRIKEIPGWKTVGEYEIPQLFSKNEKLTVDAFSGHRIELPGRLESHLFMGVKYLERGFIGRRRILRRIYKAVENNVGAVVLKGPGGIGKSTISTRAASNLNRKGFEFIIIQGETSIEGILEAVSNKAAALGLEGANNIFTANTDVKQKLVWYLNHFILKQKVVIIFDNFEENQEAEKNGEFKSERLKKFIWFFRNSLQGKPSVLFFSTRYALPGFEAIEVGEFSNTEFHKKLMVSRALKRLDMNYINTLRDEVGGNPRAMELLDKIAYEDFGARRYSWDDLLNLMREMRERILKRATKDYDFTPVLVERLLRGLTVTQRRVLDVLSVFRCPVPGDALFDFDVKMEREDRCKLVDLSLMVYINSSTDTQPQQDPLLYVHRLIAQYLLEHMEPKERNNLHIRAAEYFDAIRAEEDVSYLEDLIEARWHFIRAGEWNRAAEITFDLNKYLYLCGFRQWALELLREMDLKKIKDKNKASAHHLIGILEDHFKKHDRALTHYKKALKIRESITDSYGVASTLHQIGNNYYLKGNPTEALKQYKQSLKIRKKIKDAKGIAGSLHQIGMLYHNKGNLDEALKEYEQSLKIRKKIGDERDIAESLYQIGMLHQDKDNKKNALKKYIQALKLFEKNGVIVNAAITMGQLGFLYLELKQYENALVNLCRAYPLFSALELADVGLVIKGIADAREMLPKKKYIKILIKFQIQPQECDDIIKALEKKSLEHNKIESEIGN